MKESTIVRENLMTVENYHPHCPSRKCTLSLNRASWNPNIKQFECQCGWISNFPDDFINRYMKKWNKL